MVIAWKMLLMARPPSLFRASKGPADNSIWYASFQDAFVCLYRFSPQKVFMPSIFAISGYYSCSTKNIIYNIWYTYFFFTECLHLIEPRAQHFSLYLPEDARLLRVLLCLADDAAYYMKNVPIMITHARIREVHYTTSASRQYFARGIWSVSDGRATTDTAMLASRYRRCRCHAVELLISFSISSLYTDYAPADSDAVTRNIE